VNAIARPMHPALQRWPALARAAQQGVVVQLVNGVVARLRIGVVGDAVQVPIEVNGTVATPYGDVPVQGVALATMHVDDFGRALTAAERAGVVPQISQLLAGGGGRPLLNLPR
jgi:hypothetical protein